MKFSKKLIFASMLTVSGGLLLAQDPAPSPAPSGGWRRFDQSNPADVAPPPPDYQEPQAQTQAPPPPVRYQTQPPPARYQTQPPPASYPSQSPAPVYPSSVTIPAGTWLTVRVDQALSSDKNHEGDYFRGTLVQPVVINGLVVAPRGQSVTGIVTEAKKAGRVEGTSRLGLELTEMGLTDGRQLPKSSNENHQEVAAHWEGGMLVSDEKGPLGGKMNRTFELSRDGRQLYETLHIDNGRSPITIRYVYDAPTSLQMQKNREDSDPNRPVLKRHPDDSGSSSQ